LWWPSLTKDMQTEQLLCWSSMTDTEHTTPDSNEEDHSDYSLKAAALPRVMPQGCSQNLLHVMM